MSVSGVALSRAATDSGSRLRLRYARDHEWAEFVIDEQGRNVWVGFGEDVLLAEASELLFGPVFSCVLAKRRLTCLHAGVVVVGRRGVALVGPAGAGKSTTALALVQRGAALVSDDVAAVREEGERFAVTRGAPRMRMRPDSAARLVGLFAELDPMWVHEDRRPAKRYLEASGGPNGDESQRQPLDLICLLGPPDPTRSEPELWPLTAVEALPRLMANRHMLRALDRESHTADFERLARLVQTVPVLALARPRGLDTIERTAAALEAACQQVR